MFRLQAPNPKKDGLFHEFSGQRIECGFGNR
jgi:hypothetical protein